MNDRIATYVNRGCGAHADKGCQTTTFTCETPSLATVLCNEANARAESPLPHTFDTKGEDRIITLHFATASRTTASAALLRNIIVNGLMRDGWTLQNATPLMT